MVQEDKIQEVKDRLEELRKNRIPNLIKWLEEMEPFNNEDDIPEPPIMEKELYDKYVIPNKLKMTWEQCW